MSIFISYSHSDKTIVEPTIAHLELAFPDKKVFWDKQLLGGDVLENKLRQEVCFSQAFLFFASNNSMHKDSYCQRELHWAQTYDTHIIPYCISAAPEEVVDHLGDDNIFCIDARTRDTNTFAKLCGSIFRVVSSQGELYRKQMYLLFSILNRLDDHESYLEALEAFEGGYELNYAWSFHFDPPMSEKDCKEVLDILSMLERLQQDWNRLNEEDKLIIKEKVDFAENIIMKVGFWANEEVKQFGYLNHLRNHNRFKHLKLAFDTGNTHGIVNLPRYRNMLTNFSQLKSEQDSRINFILRRLEPDDFIRILGGY
ncbi:MAG: YfbU family protein [Chloroflexi bacterium]|nr:YfbU family protein [Chloroflexota bacterium]MCY3978616.1 YfbU family protein [Chloroflexota bacterium]